MSEDERDLFDEIDRGKGPAALVRTRFTRARPRRALGEEGWEGIKPEASRTPRPGSLRRASRPDQPHGIHQRSAARAGPRSPHVQFRTPRGRLPLRLQQRLNLTRGAERTRERRIAEVILLPPLLNSQASSRKRSIRRGAPAGQSGAETDPARRGGGSSASASGSPDRRRGCIQRAGRRAPRGSGASVSSSSTSRWLTKRTIKGETSFPQSTTSDARTKWFELEPWFYDI
jgi:hypothetical protein